MKREILFTAFAVMTLIATSCSKEQAGDTPPTPPPPETFNVWDGSEAPAFAAGTGTQSDPFQIETGAQLALLHKSIIEGAVTATSYFKLTSSIDMADLRFSPIGSKQNDALETVAFKGTFDGNGKRIKGLKIDVTKSRFTALFSYVDATATVKNLNVEGDIKNDTPMPRPGVGIYTGGIAAVNYGKIIGCTFSGNIVHTQPWGVGGIVGSNQNLVMGCAYIGAEGKKIYCPEPASSEIGVGIMGGIVGTNASYAAIGVASIIACYNTGAMESSSDGRMGGITGELFGDDPNPYPAIVVACYNRGSMVSRTGNGDGDVGGIVAHSSWGHIMTACYSAAQMTLNSIKANSSGGIMGTCLSGTTVVSKTNACYWLDTTHENLSGSTNIGTVTDCVKKTEAQLKSAEVIASLNAAIAEYNKGTYEKCLYKYVAGSDGYPVLKAE